MRSDAFDALALKPDEADEIEAFRAFLADLLTRSNAIPLPDFESLEAYQREVLQVAS
jgi:hypothetical protein